MRKLQRKKGARKALLKNLARSVILEEKIITSLPKAKEVRSLVEHFIEKGKKGDFVARRYLLKFLSKNAVNKIIEVLSPRFLTQKGGYLQILRVGKRAGDGSEMALLRFKEIKENVKKEPEKSEESDEKTSKKTSPH